MDLQVSHLEGTDLSAVGGWEDAPLPTGDRSTEGLPVLVRCVDHATAELVEELFRARAVKGLGVSRLGLLGLIERAERLRRRSD